MLQHDSLYCWSIRNVIKSIVTSEEDTTLTDPAFGYYNYAAPGSDRFSIDIVVSQFKINKQSVKIINDYNVDNVSIKVVRIILSYIDFVNRTVWRKDTVKKEFYKV